MAFSFPHSLRSSFVRPSFVLRSSFVRPSFVRPFVLRSSFVRPSFVLRSSARSSFVRPSFVRPFSCVSFRAVFASRRASRRERLVPPSRSSVSFWVLCLCVLSCRHVVLLVVSSVRLVVFFSWRRGGGCSVLPSRRDVVLIVICLIGIVLLSSSSGWAVRDFCGDGLICPSSHGVWRFFSWRRTVMRFCVCGSRWRRSVLASVHVSLVVS